MRAQRSRAANKASPSPRAALRRSAGSGPAQQIDNIWTAEDLIGIRAGAAPNGGDARVANMEPLSRSVRLLEGTETPAD
jgi:hypothetical protein